MNNKLVVHASCLKVNFWSFSFHNLKYLEALKFLKTLKELHFWEFRNIWKIDLFEKKLYFLIFWNFLEIGNQNWKFLKKFFKEVELRICFRDEVYVFSKSLTQILYPHIQTYIRHTHTYIFSKPKLLFLHQNIQKILKRKN